MELGNLAALVRAVARLHPGGEIDPLLVEALGRMVAPEAMFGSKYLDYLILAYPAGQECIHQVPSFHQRCMVGHQGNLFFVKKGQVLIQPFCATTNTGFLA